MEEIKEENSNGTRCHTMIANSGFPRIVIMSSCADVWDCGDFQGEVGAEDKREEPLCNTMLITGPPGVGKTATVYACCQELGFKVGMKLNPRFLRITPNRL